jgi:putative transposase
MITYKSNAEGIAVIVTEESYTSKASFLDEDFIPTYQAGDETNYVFNGKRISRGMYRSNNGTLINADVNGSANILRKVIPKAFANGIAAVCSQPQVVNVR